ncbi:MAG: DoxX family protein [Ardenticatenaceae bacterium]|nr:DoxX family protein [Ardenticatenaceae bacterium]
MKDLELLILRLTTGGLLAGHGSQKLFGWFGGHGLEGTGQWLESSLGLAPGKAWASAAASAEFGGGLLTALGLFNPLGPVGIISAMSMATAKVHWGKPIWASQGGAEFPLTNMAVALAVAFAGPGRYSLDHALGIRLPRWLVVLTTLAAAVGLVLGITGQPQLPPETEEEEATEQVTA